MTSSGNAKLSRQDGRAEQLHRLDAGGDLSAQGREQNDGWQDRQGKLVQHMTKTFRNLKKKKTYFMFLYIF